MCESDAELNKMSGERLTAAQAAEYLGYRDSSRVRQLVRGGKLQADKEDTPRGPILWFRRTELDAFIEWRNSQSLNKRRKGRPYHSSHESENEDHTT